MNVKFFCGKSAKIDREVEQVKKWKNFVEKGV